MKSTDHERAGGSMTVIREVMHQYIVTADEPTLNGHIYRLSILEPLTEMASGTIRGGIVVTGDPTEMWRMSHLIKSCYFEGPEFYADVSVLDTPEGHRLIDLLDKQEMCFRLDGEGVIHKDGDYWVIGENYRVRGIHAIAASEAA